MKCEPGQHRYKPFPRSRDLYCEYCGDEPGRPPIRRAVEPAAPEPPAPAEPTQQQLPLDDDTTTAAAREILGIQRQRSAEARARANLEAEVRRIVGEANLPADQAEEFIQDALNFGTELDLDKFGELIALHQQAQPSEDDAADLIP